MRCDPCQAPNIAGARGADQLHQASQPHLNQSAADSMRPPPCVTASNAATGCSAISILSTRSSTCIAPWRSASLSAIPGLRTAFGKRARCRHSLKQATAQTEPWRLAPSLNLAEFDAQAVVDSYGGRMQIEQSFRDVKNPHVGLGLSLSQTTRPDRLAILLMIGALAMFALWLIGLAAQARGYRVNFGSRAKAASTLSTISLARWWLEEPAHRVTRFRKREEVTALETLRNLAWGRQI